MKKAFVLAETADGARELAAGARAIGSDEVVLVTYGDTPDGCADRVLHITVPEGAVADDAADTVVGLYDAEAPEAVLVESTRSLKTIAGKLAHHANTAAMTGVMAIEGGRARNLYYGGVAERLQKTTAGPAIYVMAPGAFEGIEPSGDGVVEEAAWVAPAAPLVLRSSAPITRSGVDLNKADAIVAAGRGFAEEGELDLARALCEKIGGGLGCTRPLTEGACWLPTETYIGVSGLMLAPKVYIAAGVSGQMQHMVGCNRSGTIFAINKDENAPIFKQCDYGLVGDIKDVLPALVAAL